MGRKKIQIERIKDERNRGVTFQKRKTGLMKKAMELSILCDCEIAVLIINAKGKIFQYSTHGNIDTFIQKCMNGDKPHELKTNDQLLTIVREKEERSKQQQSEKKKQTENELKQAALSGKALVTKFVNHSISDNGKLSTSEEHHIHTPSPNVNSSAFMNSSPSVQQQPASTTNYQFHFHSPQIDMNNQGSPSVFNSPSQISPQPPTIVTPIRHIGHHQQQHQQTQHPLHQQHQHQQQQQFLSSSSPQTPIQSFKPVQTQNSTFQPIFDNQYSTDINQPPQQQQYRMDLGLVNNYGLYNNLTPRTISSYEKMNDTFQMSNNYDIQQQQQQQQQPIQPRSQQQNQPFFNPNFSHSSTSTFNSPVYHSSREDLAVKNFVSHQFSPPPSLNRIIPQQITTETEIHQEDKFASLVNSLKRESPLNTDYEDRPTKRRKFRELTIALPEEETSNVRISEMDTETITIINDPAMPHHSDSPRFLTPASARKQAEMSDDSDETTSLLISPKFPLDPTPKYLRQTFVPRLPLPNEEISRIEAQFSLSQSPKVSNGEQDDSFSPSNFKRFLPSAGSIPTPRSLSDLCISPSAVSSLFSGPISAKNATTNTSHHSFEIN